MVMVGTLWPYHAASMILGLALLTTGMLVARYRKARKGWLPLHKALGLSGATFALLGLITAIYMVGHLPGATSPLCPIRILVRSLFFSLA